MNWRYTLQPPDAGGSTGALRLVRESVPEQTPASGEIAVHVTARSLNYRDLLMLRGQSASSTGGGVVPLSDGAGVVVAIGEGVSEFAVGDRVTGCFFRDWQDGPFDLAYHGAARGGSCDGMLTGSAVGPAHGFVPTPGHLSDEEAACLPCAALTAWQALFERGGLQPGQTVLALGTGGVSIWALQLATAAGARVIVTSRSAEKLDRVRAWGAWETVDTTEWPDWAARVWELTEKRGVDHVIEVGGPGTLGQSMRAVAAGGHIALIGVLSGFGAPDASLFPLLARNVDLHGIYVGSRAMFARMNAFLEIHRLRPVIDRSFAVAEIESAYAWLESGRHLGKITVTG